MTSAEDFPKAVHPARVLIVEDDSDLRNCIRDYLELAGHNVLTACNGIDALEVAARSSFDVLLSDIRLPGMSGLSVAQSVRAFKPHVRVILMTAYPDWKVRQETKLAGISMLLNKPLNLKDLAERIGGIPNELMK